MSYLKEILPKILRYKLSRWHLAAPGLPINLTFSVTNVCQSRCKTCSIWKLYREQPEKRAEELSLEEIEAIFRSMGHIYVFNVSGGEPFLRTDLKEIIALACRHLSPGIVHIPTNAIAEAAVEKGVLAILDDLQRHSPRTQLTVKPSLDHIGEKHDAIRGVPGNFTKVIRLYRKLKALQPQYPNFHVELGTVISRWNVDEVAEIAAFVSDLGADSYRNEIAEQRAEMFNQKDPITPEAEHYEKAISQFVGPIRQSMKAKNGFQRITNAFRLIYYDLAVRILKEERQVIPCYAGISNAHMTPYGDIWACCTLGYDRPMGNLRDFGYDFKSLWNSSQAKTVRKFIRNRNCCCPLANQTYSNMLLHTPSLMRVGREMLAAGFLRNRTADRLDSGKNDVHEAIKN